MQIGIGLSLSGVGSGAPGLEAQIAAMYAAGEQGAWYDYSDMSTLYQDSAGTAPVTAVGQPVGRVLDKSGRGNTATQPTAINRPVLQIDGTGKYYLAFNGTNSWMQTAAIDFTATDKMTVVAGVRKLSDAATGVVAELSASVSANTGTFGIFGPWSGAGGNYGASFRGSLRSDAIAGGSTAPLTSVITGNGGISTDTSLMRINGVQVATAATDQGTGPYGNYPLYIGARAGASLFFNGNLYGLIVRSALSSDPQIASAEAFMAGKTGVTI